LSVIDLKIRIHGRDTINDSLQIDILDLLQKSF
jgi:hypothetical protein